MMTGLWNPGTEGKLVITCLHNYSFPMIRYEIGDVGTMAARSLADVQFQTSVPE